MTGPSVTSRVFAVLGAFSAEHLALTLSQLSRRAELPLTTTHRLVGELAALGALERDEHGRYRIGVRLWEIASLAPRAGGLREAAMPFLEDLFDATRENVQLAVLDGIEVLYVERLSARNAIPVISRVGGRLPVHATAVGQVLLAHSPVELQEQVLAGPLARITDKTITAPRELRALLAEVRRTGIAIADGQVETHSLSVAAPVYGSGRHRRGWTVHCGPRRRAGPIVRARGALRGSRHFPRARRTARHDPAERRGTRFGAVMSRGRDRNQSGPAHLRSGFDPAVRLGEVRQPFAYRADLRRGQRRRASISTSVTSLRNSREVSTSHSPSSESLVGWVRRRASALAAPLVGPPALRSTTRMLDAFGPRSPSSTSNSTTAPGRNNVSSSRKSFACMKTSSPPSSGAINP